MPSATRPRNAERPDSARTILLVFLLGAQMVSAAESEAPVRRYRTLGNSVNLRARPSLKSEVIGQVADGTVLIGRGFSGNWLKVEPPAGIDFWIYGEFVSGGVTTGSRVNVRGGPGTNYKEVGKLGRGQPVVVRGRHGHWVKIAPPPGSTLWINAAYVRLIVPKPTPKPLAKRVAKPKPKVEKRPVYGTKRPVPPQARTVPPPSDLMLVPLMGQGRAVTREGVLRKAGFVIGRPSKYRLVRHERLRRVTICYVKGNEAQLTSLLGRSLQIRGREYWVQGGRYAVLVPEQIVPR